MNKQEANLFFPHSSSDDLEDLWEDRFFEHKQFFLLKTPIRKVFIARLTKVVKQFEAFLVLSNQVDDLAPAANTSCVKTNFDSCVITAFNSYHSYRNQFKNNVLQAAHPHELTQVIHQWLNMEEEYRYLWKNEQAKDLATTVLISKEPDPMEVLTNLRNWDDSSSPAKTFEDLNKEYSFLPQLLQIEVKRLTLLLD